MSATMRLLGTTAEGHSGPSEEIPLGWTLRDTFLINGPCRWRRDRLGTSIGPKVGVIPLHPDRVMSMSSPIRGEAKSPECRVPWVQKAHPSGHRLPDSGIGLGRPEVLMSKVPLWAFRDGNPQALSAARKPRSTDERRGRQDGPSCGCK